MMNDWFNKCTRKLQTIARLDANWDSYGAVQPNHGSLHYAHAFLDFCHETSNVSEPAIVPNPSGTICFEWDNKSSFLFAEIDADGQIHYCREIAGKEDTGTICYENWNCSDILIGI
jgi:hypothetical protein